MWKKQSGFSALRIRRGKRSCELFRGFTDYNPATLLKLRTMQKDRETDRKKTEDQLSCRKPRALSFKPKIWQSDYHVGREEKSGEENRGERKRRGEE